MSPEIIQGTGNECVARYDLEPEETRSIVGRYIEDNNLPKGRFIGVVVDQQDTLANVARTTEREVFQETFPGNDSEFMHREYGPHEESSRFLVVLDRKTETPAGVMRIINSGYPKLKSLREGADGIRHTVEDVREYHKIGKHQRCWDVATLAVPKAYRGPTPRGVQASSMLYRMFNSLATKEKIEHVFAVVDEKALRAMKAIGIPFNGMMDDEGGFDYLGSDKSYAVYGHAPDFLDSVLNRSREVRENTPVSSVLKLGIKRFIRHRMLARAAGNLASPKFDEHIVLP